MRVDLVRLQDRSLSLILIQKKLQKVLPLGKIFLEGERATEYSLNESLINTDVHGFHILPAVLAGIF